MLPNHRLQPAHTSVCRQVVDFSAREGQGTAGHPASPFATSHGRRSVGRHFADLETFSEFWPMNEDDDDDFDEDEDFDEDYEDDDDWSYDGYGTDEDEEPYHGPYVRPRWEPPSVHVTEDEYPPHDIDEDDLRMLRRGATLQMIDMFEMTYTHEHGLCASVDNEIGRAHV